MLEAIIYLWMCLPLSCDECEGLMIWAGCQMIDTFVWEKIQIFKDNNTPSFAVVHQFEMLKSLGGIGKQC